MNKKYIGAFALAAMTLLSTGCSDFLDQDSRSNVSTDSFYKTSTGFERMSTPICRCLDWHALTIAARDSEMILTGGYPARSKIERYSSRAVRSQPAGQPI